MIYNPQIYFETWNNKSEISILRYYSAAPL